MGRRRRRRSRGGLSRRRFLAGGLLSLGGASILGGTQAFSQVDATRATSIQTAGDENGLLGLDIPEVVPVGVDSTDLIGVTNNSDEQLTASVEVTDLRDGESYDTTQRGLSPGQSEAFSASLDADRAPDEDAVNVEVTGTGSNIDIQLSRRVPVPWFSYYVVDNTEYNSTQFDIQYEVDNVPSFDGISIGVDDVSADSGPSETFSPSGPSGVVSFPDNSNTGGTEGHDFEITFEVFDADLGLVFDNSITVTADGTNEGEGNPADEDDPQLVSFDVTDDTEYNNTHFTLEYELEVENPQKFGEVQAVFDNQVGDPDHADETLSSMDSPDGEIHYPGNDPNRDEGGVEGESYNITVNVYNENGLLVDEGTVNITAGSNETVQWPQDAQS